ncbi:MAG: hypothetical protein RIS70_2964 [Planctomycetota bacterium]|jgi:Trk K+ transport system NAD-binding subunit
MRKTFLTIVVLSLLMMTVAVVVFHTALGLGWVDSLYFVVTTMTTTGYGDISLAKESTGIKLFGVMLMLTGAALMTATLGMVTDYLLHVRLENFFGRRRSRMKNHIVLCGLGHVGIRVLEQLRQWGQDVVVIEREESGRFVEEARRLGVAIVHGDVSTPSVLEQVNIKEARSIIAATDNDLANLEIALNARNVRPEIRVVLRMFDANLASKIRSGFGIKTTFSTSALAAPAFAMAAVDPSVVGSFYVGEELMLIIQVEITDGSALAGRTLGGLAEYGGMSALCFRAAKSGERQMHPQADTRLAVGDTLTLSAVPAVCQRIGEANGTIRS